MFAYVAAPGAFDTDVLQEVAAHLEALGWDRDVVQRRVFSPFIIAGNAGWSDTWGAPRYGPGPNQVRRHEGQDVFCDHGAPVIAAEAGTVEFGDDGLGGKVARVYSAAGGYWYYAHLSHWNVAEHASGDDVEVGDVIGFCGNSGNARTTAPHVHFGRYDANGEALDPHPALRRWLTAAEAEAETLLADVIEGRVERIASVSARRQFGDTLVPGPEALLESEELERILIAGEVHKWRFPWLPAEDVFVAVMRDECDIAPDAAQFATEESPTEELAVS